MLMRKFLFVCHIIIRSLKRFFAQPKRFHPRLAFRKTWLRQNTGRRISTARLNPDGTPDEISAFLNNNVTDKKARVLNKSDFQQEASVSSYINLNYWFLIDAQKGATLSRQ